MVLNTVLVVLTTPLSSRAALGGTHPDACLGARWEQQPAVFPIALQMILGVGVAVWASKPSWPMSAASACLFNSAITPLLLTCSRLCPRYRPCPQGAPRLVGKWAGGPVQSWGGQVQLQGWLC